MNLGKQGRENNLVKGRNKEKVNFFRWFLNSFKYSWDGLSYAYRNEHSLWLHAAGTIGIVIMGFVFNITFYEWAVLIIALVVVLAAELLNTAIEATVDLVTKEIHPLAKIAKDCGSAAGCITGFMLFGIALFIFGRHLMMML